MGSVTHPNERQLRHSIGGESNEVKVKMEEPGNEMKMEVDGLPDDEVIEPCHPHEHVRQCLICSLDDAGSDPRPSFAGLLRLPNDIAGLQSADTVEDDLRTTYLLKMLFQWSATELTHLMELSNGESPRHWIHICESCISLVLEIDSLQDQMRKCRAQIKKKMLESMKTSSNASPNIMTMTKRIQNLVTYQVTSLATVKAAFINGDLEAERLVNLRMEPENSYEDGPDLEENIVCQDDYETKPKRGRKKKKPSGKVKRKNNSCPPQPSPSAMDMEESFTCPYRSSGSMNMVDLFYHLIYHYDYPMCCSECNVFFPRDPSVLDAHWQQYHCNLETPPEARFIGLPAAEAEIQINEEEFPPEKKQGCSIKCNNCVEGKFDSVAKFKLHQALRHPEVARWSCPLCLEKPKTKAVLDRHLKIVHQSCFQHLRRSHLCKFCGERLCSGVNDDDQGQNTKWKLNESLSKIQKLHVMSSHAHLINGSYTCTQCSQQCSRLQDFIGHCGNTSNHNDINLNANAVKLCSFPGTSIACDLCEPVGAEQDTGIFVSVRSFVCHLTLSHSLYLKWDYDPLKPNVREEVVWKSIEEHVKQMHASRRLANIIRQRSTAIQEKQASHSKWKAKYEAARPPRYTCPACPQLKEMNVDHFIVHLLYHWRHPNKCSSCNVLLPFASEAVEEHWKQYHPESDSVTTKCELMNFAPGNIFECHKCPQKFPSFRDRNEHEQSHGSIGSKAKAQSCSVCGEKFADPEEVRLHKALDHPEVACVSCFYCATLFPADSAEGGQYLDSENLEQHIQEVEDHPKTEAGMSCHLYACEICGEVIADKFKNGKRVRTHVSSVHGKEYLKTSFMCFICNKAVQFYLWNHLSGLHAKNSICETCGEEMRPYALPDHCLVAHNLILEGYQQFRCAQEGCAYRTVRSDNFKFHMRVNHNEKRERRHKCSFCEKAFFCSRTLKEHEERHTNRETKPHQCEICGSSFAVRNYLYIHKRLSHLNQKFPSTNRKRSKKGT